jgi:hypothetical protein
MVAPAERYIDEELEPVPLSRLSRLASWDEPIVATPVDPRKPAMDPHALPAEIPDDGSLRANDGPITVSLSGSSLTVGFQPDGLLSIDNGTMTFYVSGQATKASEVDYSWTPHTGESIISVATNLRELLSQVAKDGDQERLEKRLEVIAELFDMMKARVEFGERILAKITKGTQDKGTWTTEHTLLKEIALQAAQLEALGGPLNLETDEIDAFVRIAKHCEPPRALELIEWKNIISLYKAANKHKL